MAKINQFSIDPFDSTLYLVSSRKAYLKKRAEYTDREADVEGACGMTSSFNNCGTFVIGVFDGRMSTLVHELTHLAMRLLEDRGVPLTSDNSEIMCYLLGNLVDRTAAYI